MQGYTGQGLKEVAFGDSANLDAFSRLRVSNPLTLFAAQFTYNLAPLLYEQITNGSGAAVTYNSTNRCANMAFSATPTGGKCFMQSFEYLPYQPSKSQLIFITFNFQSTSANTLKFAGYSDGVNGIEFQLDGSALQFTLYSATTQGNVTVPQANWNIDHLDGTGGSGITLDITKVQILVIDLQALYAGRVRVGFDIGGQIVYANEFLHANSITPPYLQSANLPIRCGMTCAGTVTTSMYFLCAAIASEGGTEDVNTFGYSFAQNTPSVSVSTSPTHLISLRPKTLFNGIVNRARVAFIDVEIYNSGNQTVFWQLCIGQAITGTTAYNDVNAVYSSTEYNVLGTVSGSPAIVIDAGWVSSSGSVKLTTNTAIASRYPITLNAAGAPRALGTISLVCTSLSGTQSVYGSVKFREIR